jgi:hypothetical protein
MTPEERRMLGDLFERIGSTSTAPRDPQAEAFINDSVKSQPYAPYVLAQTVLVQQQALEAAQKHIEELEQQLKTASQPQQSSFLGKLFGGGSSTPAPAPRQPSGYDASAYQRGAPGPSYAPTQTYAPQPQGYAPPPQGYAPQSGPWGAPSGGGSFLGGALQTASGVAGGVLLANAVEGLFSGGHGGGGLFGGSGAGYMGSDFGGPREEIVNNYYESGPDAAGLRAEDTLQDMDQDQDDIQDAGGGWDDNSSSDS